MHGRRTGDMAEYSCDEGYELEGDQTREYMNNSQWSCQISPGNEYMYIFIGYCLIEVHVHTSYIRSRKERKPRQMEHTAHRPDKT